MNEETITITKKEYEKLKSFDNKMRGVFEEIIKNREADIALLQVDVKELSKENVKLARKLNRIEKIFRVKRTSPVYIKSKL